MKRKEITRRQFIKSTAVLAGTVLTSCQVRQTSKEAPKRTAGDQVTLGKTGLKLSRLGIGTGSNSGRTQMDLGPEKFNRLIRYGYERGITYIDTADSYKTHKMVADAIKPLPREKLFIQTKMMGVPEKPLEVIDRYRRELKVDYIDSLLVHCVVSGQWDQKRKALLDAFEEAKQKKIILSHGVSCHSLPATSLAAQLDWVDVNLVRVNPQGVNIDTLVKRWNAPSGPSHVAAVIEQLKIMRKNRHGVIGMKIIGDGDFVKPEDREKSIRFAMHCGLLDSIVIGFKDTAQIDEAIGRINSALVDSPTS